MVEFLIIMGILTLVGLLFKYAHHLLAAGIILWVVGMLFSRFWLPMGIMGAGFFGYRWLKRNAHWKRGRRIQE